MRQFMYTLTLCVLVCCFGFNASAGQADSHAKDASKFSNRLRDTFYSQAQFEVYAYGQLTHALERPFRLLARVDLSSQVELTRFLQLNAKAMAVVPLDFASTESPDQELAMLAPYFLLQELVLQWHATRFHLNMGRLIVPWGGVLGVELNNRLNPIDYRRGPNFTSGIQGRIPEWGFEFQVERGGYTFQLATFFNFLSAQGPLFASEQGGFHMGAYQGAYFRSLKASRNFPDKALAHYPQTYYFQPALGFQVSKDFGRSDLALNAAWSNDSKARIFSKGFQENPNFQKLSLGLHLRTSFDYFLFKAEALYVPRFSHLGEGMLLLWERPSQNLEGSFRTIELVNHMGLAFGAEASIGESIEGGLAILTKLWWGFPEFVTPLGIEGSRTTAPDALVGRLALVLALKGQIADVPLIWNLRSEIGIWRPDIALHFDLAYEFEELGFSTGLFLDGFFGFYGTPAWMRHGQNAIGLFVSHSI